MKTTEENNRLIAEFMGLVESSIPNKFWTEKTKEGFGVGKFVDLNYHTSWEWLMSVVEKIENIQFNVEQSGGSCTIHPCVLKEPVFETYSTNRLEATYQAVIQFIEWYNENKNQ